MRRMTNEGRVDTQRNVNRPEGKLPAEMFLPRSLHHHQRPRLPPLPPPPPALTVSAVENNPPSEDPAILCALAFSDYEIWSNPTLRDPNHDGCKVLPFSSEPKRCLIQNEAVVSLRTLVHTSPVFLATNGVSLTEGSIVKSLRTHATDIFDIHMIVVDKTRSRRGRHGYAPVGGYKVRRKDWAEVTHRFPTFSPEYWDARTIYIVCTP
jgi:hypothetical protein